MPKILFNRYIIFITHWFFIIDSSNQIPAFQYFSHFTKKPLEILSRHQPATEKTTDLVDRFAAQIFAETDPQGMAIIFIDNDQIITRYYGETAPGSRKKPDPNSLIRIASLTKLMTSKVMIKFRRG